MEQPQEHDSVIMATIEKGSTVLVTGVNGYIASHVADQLLQAGYKVRGTSRSKDKTTWLYELFDKKYGAGKFEAVEVADMIHDGAFDEAVKGVSGICHVASIMTFSDKPDEVIPPTVKGALNILTSATKEPSVKSLVYTSSSTAALMPDPGKEIIVKKDTWDDLAVQKAGQPNPSGFEVYSASKTEAERAIWKAVEATKPPFQVCAVLPNANFGPILRGADGVDSSSTGGWCPTLFNGGGADMLKSFPSQWFVDVRDTARLHVIGLIDPSCANERLFAFAETYTWNQIFAIMRKQFPDRKIQDDWPKAEPDLSVIPNEDAIALLQKHYGHGFVSLEDSIAANLASIGIQ